MSTKQCNYNQLGNKIAILVSKKRCLIQSNCIMIKKGVSKKNAIIKIRGLVIPKEINTKLYESLFVIEKDVEHIEYYN